MNSPASPPPPRLYEFGDFQLDVKKRQLRRPDQPPVTLTPRVFATLRFLLEHNNTVIEKEQLMAAVWPDSIVEENNLSQQISTLRRLLGENAGSARFIVTVPGHGYRFAANVVPREAEVKALPVASPPTLAPTAPPTPPRAKLWTALAATAAVLVLLAALYFSQHRRAATSPIIPAKSVAVLPFDNLSNDPANAYFVDGITDEVLTRLAKVGTLKVTSRTSALKFRNTAKSTREIARELGVAHVLEGSVQRSGDAVRVTAQLIDARTDTHLWAEEFDRKVTDLFAVESEISQRIVGALSATLTAPEKQLLASKPTADPQAHEAYLKGRFFWNKRTAEAYRQANGYFREAVQHDPAYPEAWAGLADSCLLLAGESVPDEKQALEEGRRALRRSLELDPNLSDAHDAAGLLAMNFDWDWPMADREFRRAIALAPNDATAHQRYGEFLVYVGRVDEGLAEARRARELDPLSLIVNTDLGKNYFNAGRIDEAIAQLRRTLELDPQYPLAHVFLGLAYAEKGEQAAAVAELRAAKNWETTPYFLACFTAVYGCTGDEARAAEILARLQALSQRSYVSPYMFAMANASLGKRDQAFYWLDRVVAERTPLGAINLRVNPLLKPIRTDPRFALLLQRVHLAGN